MATTELDYFEYSSDANAQAAYVTNDASALQVYSEASLKTQGSYSMKGVAQATTSLSKNLTRSVSPAINLSGQLTQYFDVRASRTGSNLTVGLRNNPYPTDSYTKLLIHGGGLDGNVPKAMTFVGTAQLDTAQKKFGSASLVLDGNSDYLTTPDHADWSFGTGDFTVDFWVRFSNITGAQSFVGQYESGTSSWYLVKDANHKLRLSFTAPGDVSVAEYLMSSAWSVAANIWYHVAFERTTTTAKVFIDGVSQTLTETTAFGTNNTGNVAAVLDIGQIASGNYLNGWIDELRISKGVARWSANFIPPTLPHIPDQYTALLLQFEGADAATATYDSCGGDSRNLGDDKAPTYVGTTQIDTAQSKFGGSSLLLDGDSDYVTYADNADWDFGDGNFTIDMWIRINAFPGSNGDMGLVGQYVDSNNYWILYQYNAGGNCGLNFVVRIGGVYKADYYISNAGFVVNTWYHIALVRNGTSVKLYVNGDSTGTVEGTAIGSYAIPDLATVLYIGDDAGIGEYYFNGWIDGLRVSKGIARWTSNFTPPSRAYASHTVMEYTPSLASANTWTTVQTDISGVAAVDRQAIDQIQITVINADA